MPEHTDEVGTIRRANLLLRLLATAGKRGLALTELSARCKLPHPTVHRLLKQLHAEGLIAQNEETRRYLLGQVIFELGLAAAEIVDIRHICAPSLQRLSEETEDTVYFVMRSGCDAVCIDRREGTYPIRTITLDIGSRRPLGVGAGGLAILSALPDHELEDVLAATASRLASYGGLDTEMQRTAVQHARDAGYAMVRNRVTLGVTAIGLSFRDSMDRPVGALSIGAIDARISGARRLHLIDNLKREIRGIESNMRTIKALSE
ncbi:IclR family transcriptional regulator [Paraburkholderia sediminicola]|uniref:IclR family transcriptional regulator n=1 Tax=Paraburkholderia sediminicola TaxID=458836 RepID=UPI0038B8D0B4